MEFVVFDLETTGLGDTTEICEFSFVRFKDGKLKSSLSSLVKPSHSADWQSGAIKVHGITKSEVKNMPSLAQFKSKILAFCKDVPVFAHNASFDINRLMSEVGLEIEAYCSLRISREILGNPALQKLDDISKSLGIAKNETHRAESDAIACAEVVIELLSRSGVTTGESLQQKFGRHRLRPTLRSMENASRGPKNDRALRKSDFDELVSAGAFTNFENAVFAGKTVIFSDLKTLSRTEAQMIILKLGGFSLDNVSKKTDFLVMGDIASETTKKRSASKINSNGGGIRIVSEEEFLVMVNAIAKVDLILGSE